MSEQHLIFLHIPKTGGSTMRSVIAHQYSSCAVYTIEVPSPEGIEEFKKLPEEKRAQIKVLQGHMGFGLHRYLHGSCTYFTILRDPVERIISRYYYELSKSPPPAYMYSAGERTSRLLTIEEYIRSGFNKLVENGQTRLLSASEGKIYDVGFGQCSREMLAEAIKNLQNHFVSFGILEKFDESLILLRRKLGWRFPFYVRKRVTQRSSGQRDISESARQVIGSMNKLDVELYEWGKQKLREEIARQGPGFHAELSLFELLNRVFGRAYDSVRPIDN
jgi:hypothetical protein